MQTATPDFDNLPELVESTRVAQIIGVKPASLRMYVKRGQLAPPAQKGDNMTWYRRDDVRAAWERRQAKKEQQPVQEVQQALDSPEPARDITLNRVSEVNDAAGLELVKLTQPLFVQIARQQDALAEKDETIRQLASQLTRVSENATAERNRADRERAENDRLKQAMQQKAEQPRTRMQKLLDTLRGK